jgi:hypothetical protein
VGAGARVQERVAGARGAGVVDRSVGLVGPVAALSR